MNKTTSLDFEDSKNGKSGKMFHSFSIYKFHVCSLKLPSEVKRTLKLFQAQSIDHERKKEILNAIFLYNIECEPSDFVLKKIQSSGQVMC